MNTKSSFKNLSLCVYIGNTSSFDDQTLINYCSQYGEILSCSIENCPDDKRLFCDFRIIEFANKEQLDYFLHISIHKIGSIILDVKIYQNLLDNFDILNIDRKLFIGPILNSNNLKTITQFYKLIDRNFEYCLSQQDNQVYILMEFSHREYIRVIIEQKTIPKTIDNQIFTIHIPIHPKEFLTKQISKLSSSTIENTEEYDNNQIDQLLEATISNSVILDTNKENISIVTEPISIPSPDECGWASPPRAVIINHYPPVGHPPERLSSKPSTTTMDIDHIYQSRVIEIDTKPMKNRTNNIFQFIEQFQNEIDQIKDEYMIKFTKDRTSVEHEINRLMNNERQTIDKLKRYLYEHRRRSIKS